MAAAPLPPRPTREIAVTVDRVTKRYGQTVAVDDVSFEVAQGEFVTLLGPSGCGKTTLLRLISGFIEPTAGDIRLHEGSVLGVPPYRRNTSMVFQDYALFPHRTVAQNIGFGLRMRGVPPAAIERRVETMLELLNLSGLGGRRIGAISGGQAQRVALGRALVVEPAVLLLDEPLGALDLKLRKQMQTELKGIQRRVGATFLYVTHDQEEALTMSDRVAVMSRGHIEQLDAPLDVYRRPANPFVADFIGEANLIPGRVAAVAPPLVRVESEHAPAPLTASVAGPEVKPGDPVLIVVRPEDLHVDRTGTRTENAVRGRVRDVVFSGPATKVVVEVGPALSLAALVRPGEAPAADGSAVAVWWAPEDAVVVARAAENPQQSLK